MMAKTVKTVGTGITADEIVTYDGEDIYPAIRQFTEQFSSAVKKNGGIFAAISADAFALSEAILQRAGKRPYAEQSEAWYAEEFLRYRKLAQDFINKGDPDNATNAAFRAGYIICEASMKFRWEDDALRGQGFLKYPKMGHESVHGTDEQKRQRWRLQAAAFDDAYAETPKKTAAYALAAERCKCSERSIRRALKRREAGEL